MERSWTMTAATYPMPTPYEEILVERRMSGDETEYEAAYGAVSSVASTAEAAVSRSSGSSEAWVSSRSPGDTA